MTSFHKKYVWAALVLFVGIFSFIQFFPRHTQPKEIDGYILSEMKECSEKSEKGGCYQDAATDFLSRFSFEEILKSLERTEKSPEIFSRCHELTHYIGRNAYQGNPDIPRLYGEGSPVCHGGFYHGVIEGYFKARYPKEILQDSEGKLAEDVLKVCGKIGDYAVPRFYGECVHGVGHAMMLVTSENLPRALNYCDAFTHQMEKDACYGGVVMQNSWGLFTQGHSTEYLKKNDPMYPCNTLPERHKGSCYAYQAFYFAELAKWDWKEMAALCREEPKEYQGGCFTVIGLLRVEHASGTNPAEHYAVCKLAKDPTLIKNCVQGVVDSLGGRYVGDSVPMDAFCAVVDEKDKATCYGGMGSAIATWSKGGKGEEGQDSACWKIANAKWKDMCNSGAALMKARISEL